MHLTVLSLMLCMPRLIRGQGKPSGARVCPSPAEQFKMESCYVFITKAEIKYLWRDIWKEPDRTPYRWHTNDGKTELVGAVWEPADAQKVCRYMGSINAKRYKKFENFTWHLPVIETQEEDDFLDKELRYRFRTMGTSVWLDLMKEMDSDTERWQYNNQPALYFSLPDGIDRMWENSEVMMGAPSYTDDPTCYEMHINKPVTREPVLPRINIRGWHPRACHDAYTMEVRVDEAEDHSVRWGNFMRGIILGIPCRERVGCVDTYDWHQTRTVGTGFKRLEAPTGVICEADARQFFPGGTRPTTRLTTASKSNAAKARRRTTRKPVIEYDDDGVNDLKSNVIFYPILTAMIVIPFF